MRTGKLDFHEIKTLHANFKEFVDKHKDVIGNVLDFAVVSDDSTRNLEVRRWDIMLPLECYFIKTRRLHPLPCFIWVTSAIQIVWVNHTEE